MFCSGNGAAPSVPTKAVLARSDRPRKSIQNSRRRCAFTGGAALWGTAPVFLLLLLIGLG